MTRLSDSSKRSKTNRRTGCHSPAQRSGSGGCPVICRSITGVGVRWPSAAALPFSSSSGCGSLNVLVRKQSPPRRAGRSRADRLPAGETSGRWRVAVGRDCGNGGVFPGGTCLQLLPPPHSQQRNSLRGARAVLCVCESWHSPLRQASRDFKELRLSLRFQCCQRVSQPTAKPHPEKFPDFLLLQHSPSYEGLQAELAGLAGSVVEP